MTINGGGMRVVHIVSGDLFAGAEMQLYHLVKELHHAGEISVSVILLNHGILEQRLRNEGVDVEVFDEARLSGFLIWRRVLTALARRRPDILHTHRQKENVIGAMAAVLLGNIRIVQTVHGAREHRPSPWQFLKRLYAFLDYVSARYLSDRIVAVSGALGEALCHRFPQGKIVAIENGVDPDEIQRMGSEPADIPGPSKLFKIAIVGRLVPAKRVDLFLSVARALIDIEPANYSFYVFGDGPLLEDIKVLKRDLSLEHHVYLMGFTENLPACLTRMDLLLITSDHEGLPMNLLEAMALSVPVVAHAVGGIPEVLGDGEYGTLVYQQEIRQYSSAVATVIRDRAVTAVKTGRAKERVMRKYSSSIVAAKYAQLYRSL